MITIEELTLFASMAADLKIAPAVAGCDPIPPMAIGVKADRSGWALFPAANLLDAAFRDPEKLRDLASRFLSRAKGKSLMIIHEAWISRLPGIDAEEFERRFSHLKWRPEGRAEAVICVIHAADVQTAVVHGISRADGKRTLIKGPMLFDGLSLGGAMARNMPKEH